MTPEILDKLLAHDRWKTQVQLDHEYRLEELKRASHQSKRPSDPPVDGDFEFNKVSSYGSCSSEQIKSVSKTRVFQGARARVNEIFQEWSEGFVLSAEFKVLSESDKKSQKPFKDILTLLLGSSSCMERFKRWGESCKDYSKIGPIRTKVIDEIGSYKEDVVKACVIYTGRVWKKFFPLGLDLNTELFTNAIGSITLPDPMESRILTSPLFSSLQEKFPHLPESSFVKLADRLVSSEECVVQVVMRFLYEEFQNNYPAEAKTDNWNMDWREVYRVDYEKIWAEQVKALEESTREAQVKWKEGLTS